MFAWDIEKAEEKEGEEEVGTGRVGRRRKEESRKKRWRKRGPHPDAEEQRPCLARKGLCPHGALFLPQSGW